MTTRFVRESLTICEGTLSVWFDLADDPGPLRPVEDGFVSKSPSITWSANDVDVIISSLPQLVTLLRSRGCDPRSDIASAPGSFATIVTFLERDPGRVISRESYHAFLEPEYTDFDVDRLSPRLDGNVVTYGLFEGILGTREARVAEVRVDLNTGEVRRDWRDLHLVT